MGLIREPKNVDFSTKSEPWTAAELADFRKIMQSTKVKYTSQRKVSKNELSGKKQDVNKSVATNKS